jgi:Cytochrome c554 and c-prime
VRRFLIFWALILCLARSSASQAPTDSSNTASNSETSRDAQDRVCSTCHQDKSNSYRLTAHFRTSRMPTPTSIAGSFVPGKNTMATFNPQLSFRMEERDGSFYQTELLQKPSQPVRRSEQIGIVVGSATKGQTYLYWQGDRLFELPVSYWTALKSWVNSPGYIDGSADFDRPVTPRCLECHATFFQPLASSPSDNQYNTRNFVLGISCERCHGATGMHVEDASKSPSAATKNPLPPLGLDRDRQIDICAQCHGGVGKPIAASFSFQPGAILSAYLSLPQPGPKEPVDVHGNQVALLLRSSCYRSSPTMSCSTCHDVHAPERSAASYSAVCLDCHQQKDCGMFAKRGSAIAQDCIDCHMPVQDSQSLALDTDAETRLPAKVRNHWIRVYTNTNTR